MNYDKKGGMGVTLLLILVRLTFWSSRNSSFVGGTSSRSESMEYRVLRKFCALHTGFRTDLCRLRIARRLWLFWTAWKLRGLLFTRSNSSLSMKMSSAIRRIYSSIESVSLSSWRTDDIVSSVDDVHSGRRETIGAKSWWMIREGVVASSVNVSYRSFGIIIQTRMLCRHCTPWRYVRTYGTEAVLYPERNFTEDSVGCASQ